MWPTNEEAQCTQLSAAGDIHEYFSSDPRNHNPHFLGRVAAKQLAYTMAT